MAYVRSNEGEKQVISVHDDKRWERRDQELAKWVQRDKRRKRAKQTVLFGNLPIDAEMLGSIAQFKRMGIQTEYSCSGVSILDEPEEHSLYGYITLIADEQTDRFVAYAIQVMRHRLLVTYEPARLRYDLSSFYISHNRSFCLLLERCAKRFHESTLNNQA